MKQHMVECQPKISKSLVALVIIDQYIVCCEFLRHVAYLELEDNCAK